MNDLQQAVIEQLGYSELDEDCKATLEDIVNHGVDGGFHGFTYYSDTIKFFDDNRSLILSELADLAGDIGVTSIDVVRGFRCLQLGGDNWNHEIDQVLMGIDCDDDTQIKNALSWFAAEQVAYQLESEQ